MLPKKRLKLCKLKVTYMISLVRAIFLFFFFSSCASQNTKTSEVAKMNEKNRYVNNYIDESRIEKGKFFNFFFKSIFDPPKKKKFPIDKMNKTIFQNKKNILTWSGHSTFLYQNTNLNILIDPHLTSRASPFSYIGPKRYMPSLFNEKNLPKIDVVAVSHNHYDHLDIKSLRLINKKYPKTLFLVPLGDKELLISNGIKNVKEFDWWDSLTISETKFVFTPVQHWSKRNLFDRNKSLWGGWWIEHLEKKFLHLGDTGYTKDFIDIKNRLGSPDYVAIPIGAYEPRYIMKNSHLNPEEAVKTFIDLEAKLAVAMHWGTFILSSEPVDEPPKKLKENLLKYKVDENSFKVLKHGESIILN